MALQSCYECNKKISTKALMCPQCGAPQNPVSGLIDKAKEGGGFLGKTFNKAKNNIKEFAEHKAFERIIDENLEQWVKAKNAVEQTQHLHFNMDDQLIQNFMEEMGIPMRHPKGYEVLI